MILNENVEKTVSLIIKKVLLFVTLAVLLTIPITAKTKVGFGSTIMIGPNWATLATGGDLSGSISERLVLNLDMHLGINFTFSKKNRILLGSGVRPRFSHNENVITEIYPLRFRACLGLFTIYGGMGIVTFGKCTVYVDNFGIGATINIGNHFAILLDVLDISLYVSGGVAILVNSNIGINFYF